ncbi:hypothetical protein SMSP2_02743 [Limihaloglobus sulfuriphilus]|uniref:phospholipase D n=1 Tax=Limihaloglobus sulfuriphilus TaxID=1851148 RepID=A0A1Q2MI53_9BACT|nr:phospholipase D-like domain-containing protein [Limihaloglobus sulfuriphilus]AQQ72360.1 hypothetical protein SMSP2_02743 [Limihaloglobus sulfuriphilus]
MSGCQDRLEEQNSYEPARINVKSPWFPVEEEQLELQISYSGFNPDTQKKFSRLSIGEKTLEMIREAEELIFATVFLFDIFKVEQPMDHIAEKLTDTILESKSQNPRLKAALILDPVNRAYSDFQSPAEKRLLRGGVDIFYSNLHGTKPANLIDIHKPVGVTIDLANQLTMGNSNKLLTFLFGWELPINNPLNPEGVSMASLWNALAMKANHRKILVTASGEEYHAMISSANPHNASVGSANHSITFGGECAKYTYMVMREDAVNSANHYSAQWSRDEKQWRDSYFEDILPAVEVKIPEQNAAENLESPQIRLLTELEIKNHILAMLENASESDKVRIQMFYLSDLDIVQALIDAAGRLDCPIRLILDPNKDAFNSVKDGTPNRQVAAYLMEKKQQLCLNMDIRWYETHGEQNHAKTMSITNEKTGKHEFITGSANWTGKNLKGINLEADLAVRGSKKINKDFNRHFDLLWNNSDGMIYTIGYSEKYNCHSGYHKWFFGELFGYVSW